MAAKAAPTSDTKAIQEAGETIAKAKSKDGKAVPAK
jgi:hypothetical protein